MNSRRRKARRKRSLGKIKDGKRNKGGNKNTGIKPERE